MGIYQKLIPKQSCVLCEEMSKYCVCKRCELSFTSSSNRCLSCAVKMNSHLSFCAACLSYTPTFSRAYTLFDYSSLCAQLIKQFKFDKQLCIGDYFAHQLYNLYSLIAKQNISYDAIIPMPLSASRISQRGYNQIHELLSSY